VPGAAGSGGGGRRGARADPVSLRCSDARGWWGAVVRVARRARAGVYVSGLYFLVYISYSLLVALAFRCLLVQ